MMSSVSRLVDYFVIGGLNTASGLEPDQLSGDNLHCPPLDRPFKARILAHYPDLVPGNPFDQDAVCMLCFPRGLQFQTQQEPRLPYHHTFVITREDGTRVYGAAFTSYELVDNRQICTAMQTLQAMHMAELSNAQSQALYSHLGSVYKRSPRLHRRPDPNSVGKVYNMKHDSLFVTKSICVISQLPIMQTFAGLLLGLHEIVVRPEEPDMPLESFVYNIIHEVPLPPPGRSMRLTAPERCIICQIPGALEMPLLDYSLQDLFTLLGVDNVLSIFTCFLLEHQVILHSRDYEKLMLVSEGVSALIFPFSWQHVYVPILPASLSHFLDAPVPFIMGLHHNTDHEGLHELCSKANMCLVDIDNAIVEVPEDLPMFPHIHELKDDIKMELARITEAEGLLNGHQRDSGFIRDSFCGFDDSGMSSAEASQSSSLWSIPGRLELLQQNEAMAKITALAKKTGVISSLDDIRDSLNDDLNAARAMPQGPPRLAVLDTHTRDLIVNSSLREIFLHYFLQIFASYENFIITHKCPDMETWLSNRESMQTFDKTAFLSDHAEAHLPFLSIFLETQMFTTFIDIKILSQWEESDQTLRVFEGRLRVFKEDLGDQRIRKFYRSGPAKEAESVIEKRAINVDLIAPLPKMLEGVHRKHRHGSFPMLTHSLLNRDAGTPTKKRDGVRWRKKERHHQHSEHLKLSSEQKEKYMQEARSKARQPKLSSDMTPTTTNWKFVDTLLKECKAKTKRMLVEKMGQEAVELGHGDLVNVKELEENTLIASLCDLLERIWSHGLQQKQQEKSSLWHHLVSFQNVEQAQQGNKPIDPNLLTPDLSSSTFEVEGGAACPSGTQTWPIRRHRRKPSRGPEMPTLTPLPVSVMFDMKNVQQMAEIKTAMGFARAWVRLSLEKKMLSRHLKELLSNTDLLKTIYKRYSFLRCEDEREQFLYHLLGLNAVDYYCFTNTFTTTVIPYHILVFPRQKLSGATTTANCWLSLAGQLGDTSKISIPKHQMDFSIQHKNLGVLTTMRVGHDNAGMSPKWMVEHVLVRNEVTGHTYRFPNGRWLGRGVDDGALERLLVAELVPPSTDASELVEKCRTPPRCRSPSMPRRSNEPRLQVSDIQEMLGDAVNNLVKHFYKPEKERGSITGLLCGEYGLVYCMEHVFQCGFKSARLFRNRFFVWDFLEKVQGYMDSLLSDEETYDISQDIRRTMQSYCYIIAKINQASESIGKDGRFQIFICIGVRDRLLQRWIRIISKTPITSQMYEEQSFLRDPALVQFLCQILDSLKEFNIVLEASLIKGVDL